MSISAERSIVFACLAGNEIGARQSLILARSVRAFGGSLADSPIWVLTREGQKISTRPQLEALGVTLLPIPLEDALRRFPFAGKTVASGMAEDQAAGRAPLLAWLDADALVVREPAALLLPPGKDLGYRPVDHTLIGSPYDQAPDPFWQRIYEACGVEPDALFPMITSVDRRRIRPYFNAGCLVVRPERGLLRRWGQNFQELYRAHDLRDLYEQDERYLIFVHQAVLAGTVLSMLARDALHELPYRVNYPLHMHDSYPLDRRPRFVDELISFRYDLLAGDPHWPDKVPMREPLRSWLKEQVSLDCG